MKKILLVIQLLLLYSIPVLILVFMYNNIIIWEYCPFGVEYLAVFSLSYFANTYMALLWIFIAVIIFNILLGFSIIWSYIKHRNNYIVVCVLIIDMIISFLLGFYITMLLDLIMSVFYIASGKKLRE